MQTYVVDLQSAVSTSFRCQKAANSLDIDVEKKSRHHLEVKADLKSPYNIGCIIGASGSGKTTLAKTIWGQDCFKELLDPSRPIIEQFPEEWSYDDCAVALGAMGLTSVPCWIRPAYTLSNGQKSRAEAALQLAYIKEDTVVIDEWTSVVDRSVAKVMSHCVQKYARKFNKRIVLCACHFDIVDWLNPDWVVDCNKQEYTNRRDMVGTHKRSDQLRLDIREVGRGSWHYFSKYHYLSSNLPGGKIYTYGLFSGEEQIGFQCFAAYIPGDMNTYFSNRTVVHPDYAGLGLGIKLITETSKIMIQKDFRVKAKFSSEPVYKAMKRDPFWKLVSINKDIKKQTINAKQIKKGITKQKIDAMRNKTITYSFDFIWKPKPLGQS